MGVTEPREYGWGTYQLPFHSTLTLSPTEQTGSAHADSVLAANMKLTSNGFNSIIPSLY